MTTKLTTPKQSLPQTAYRKLVSDISNIFEQARKTAKEEIDRIALRARWAIGRRIVREEQSGKLRAEYGEQLLEQLSRDLTKKYGAGFSETNLGYMREFYLAYPKWPIPQAFGELSWAHYTRLLAVNEKERRDFLGKQAIESNWSTRRLASEIKKYREKLSKEPLDKVTGKGPQLSVTRGRLNTYKIIAADNMHPTSSNVVIDGGFQIKIDIPSAAVNKFKAGAIVEAVKTSKGYEFKLPRAQERELYTFRAIVINVIDADTLLVNADCGFGIWITQRLRLRGIDAPDISTKRGLQAWRFVKERLSKVDFIIIQTHKSDKYDRYLVDIFYLEGEQDPERVLREGTYLNQELIDAGLAVVVDE